MFNTIYKEIKQNLTRGNRRKSQRLAVSLKKKGISGKLTRDERDFLKKIDNHIERSHYDSNITREDIIEWVSKLDEGGIYEWGSQQFVKDALKQNASEKAQLKCMEERGFPMSKMSASGKNSLRFDEKSLKLISTKKEGSTSRSFDYRRECEGFTEYFTGKVTFGQGGSQNKVKEEIIHFLKRAKSYLIHNPDSNELFTALIDGDSYTEEDYKEFDEHTSDRVRVLSSDNYCPYVPSLSELEV